MTYDPIYCVSLRVFLFARVHVGKCRKLCERNILSRRIQSCILNMYIHTYLRPPLNTGGGTHDMYMHTHRSVFFSTIPASIYINTLMHTYIHSCMHTHIHAYIHAYTHAYIHSCRSEFCITPLTLLRVCARWPSVCALAALCTSSCTRRWAGARLC